jgi:hypothetical protein
MSNRNGTNNWDVPYCDITFFQRILDTHKNIHKSSRHDDILFEVDRIKQGDHLRIFCCRQYSMSDTLVQKALAEFGALDIIYVGGAWNAGTSAAGAYCADQKIGIYNSTEINGALWKDEYWNYQKPD